MTPRRGAHWADAGLRVVTGARRVRLQSQRSGDGGDTRGGLRRSRAALPPGRRLCAARAAVRVPSGRRPHPARAVPGGRREPTRLTLRLSPEPTLASAARQGLPELTAATAPRRPPVEPEEAAIPLEASGGGWVTRVKLNDMRTARFLVDTGASVTVLSPELASELRIRPDPDASNRDLPRARRREDCATGAHSVRSRGRDRGDGRRCHHPGHRAAVRRHPR